MTDEARDEQDDAKQEATPEAADIEGSLARLEEIVKSLEGEEVTLDRSLELFEEGVRLAAALKTRLEEGELRIKEVLDSTEGFSIKDFEP